MTADLDTTKALRSARITTTVAAELLGVTSSRISQLTMSGVLPPKEGKWFSLADVVTAFVGNLRNDARRTTISASASRKDDARTREIELRIAEKEGRLIDLEEHDAILDEVISTVVVGLNSLAPRVTRNPAIRATIEQAVNAIRTELADKMQARARELNAATK